MRGERGLSRLCPEYWASPSQSRQRSEATDGPESTLRPRKRHRPHERKTCPQQMMQSLLQTSNLLHFPTCTPCRGTDFSEVGVFNATSFLSRVVVGTNDGWNGCKRKQSDASNHCAFITEGNRHCHMEQSVCAGRGEGKLLPLLTLLSSTVLKTRGQNPSLHCSLTWRGPPSGRHIHPLVCQDSSGETQARYSSEQLPEYRFKGWLKG